MQDKYFQHIKDFLTDPDINKILPSLGVVWTGFLNNTLFDKNLTEHCSNEILVLVYYSSRNIIEVTYNNIVQEFIIRVFDKNYAKISSSYIYEQNENQKAPFSFKKLTHDKILDTEQFYLATVYGRYRAFSNAKLFYCTAYDYASDINVLKACGAFEDDNNVISSKLILDLRGLIIDKDKTMDIPVSLDGFDARAIQGAN